MKIATIGTGFIVESFLTAVEQNEDMECIGVYSRKEESGRALADKFHIMNVYTDLEEMLQCPEIEFIYVASPNSLHFEQSLKALQAGKHVICEKPFTSTVQELDILLHTAKEKQLYLFEAIVTLHMPNYKLIQQQINNLGTIRMVQCNFSQYSSRYDKFLAGEVPNVFSPKFSGGALADINIYNLHFTIGLFGKPKAVMYYPNIAENGIDTSGVAILDYGDFKSICVGCKDTKSENIAQIQGEKGYITLHSETSRCSNFELHIKEETAEPVKQNDVAIFYELQDFNRIYKAKDYKACEEGWKHSHLVMEVYEEARKKGGIVFTADNKVLK